MRSLLALGLNILVLASCATVSGLADYDVVDCPGDACDAASAPSRDASASDASAEEDAPAVGCDPSKDASCLAVPSGFTLVAVADGSSSGVLPACPKGFDDASVVGKSPVAATDTCECEVCAVTQQAICAGAPTVTGGTAGVCDTTPAASDYSNVPPGGCNEDFQKIDRTGQYVRVKLAPPTGGACVAGPATAHPERVDLAERRRVCDETARCKNGLCNAEVSAPFEACVASAEGSGDVACPAGFPNKTVAGSVKVSCDSTGCGCNVERSACKGTLTYWKNSTCSLGSAVALADDTCRPTFASGVYTRYKIMANTQTSCTATGASSATVTTSGARTICCR